MPYFTHAGDLGDIVYSLPALCALGGGVLTLAPTCRTRVPMTPGRAAHLKRLLEAQPYIEAMEYADRPRPSSIDLNIFRRHLRLSRQQGYTLMDLHLCAFGLPVGDHATPWLTANPIGVADVLIHRSHRYRNPAFPWAAVLAKYAGRICFVGLPDEYESFCGEFHADLPYHTTADLLDLSRAIAGCKLFVGNQSCPFAIAEGLKQRAVLEAWPRDPNCSFRRDGLVVGMDERVALPEID